MSDSFAKSQPAGYKNYVENIAVVGVAGQSGSVIAAHLLQGGKHRVTAITRPDSTSKMPLSLHDVKRVDYSDHAGLVKALEGQDVLVITMGVTAPPDTVSKLIAAALEAGVKYIMPNEWGSSLDNVQLSKDTFMYDRFIASRKQIEVGGGNKTHWIGLACSFWYEFSLAGTEARYGFDFDKKTLTLYDDGTKKINTTTWPQVGRAVANLLSLKILPDDQDDKSPCLSHYNNRSVYVSSFFVSQRDMFASVLRVTGDNEKDWTVTHENVVERYQRGVKMMQEGKMIGFGIALYARVFYPDGAGDYNDKLDNDALGLPKEDFDEATRVAVKMALAGEKNTM